MALIIILRFCLALLVTLLAGSALSSPISNTTAFPSNETTTVSTSQIKDADLPYELTLEDVDSFRPSGEPEQFAHRTHGLPNSMTHGIDSALLHKFQAMSQYAAAAYCPSNEAPATKDDEVACSTGNCALVEHDHVKTVLRIENTPVGDLTGFITVDHVRQEIITVFRGAESPENFDVITKFFMKRIPAWCKKCKISKGMSDAWDLYKAPILEMVLSQSTIYPEYRVVFTGHSMGGALATMAAANYRTGLGRRDGEKIDLVTFGAPRMGNWRLSQWLTEMSNTSYRVTALDDPVPKLPHHWFGFAHLSPEYHIIRNAEDPAPADFDVLVGYSNRDADIGHHKHHAGRWPDHRTYFQKNISACQTTPDNSELSGGSASPPERAFWGVGQRET